MKQYRKDDIKQAYRQLKAYMFYAGNAAFYRTRIARFESANDFDTKLSRAADLANGDDALFDRFAESIRVFQVPKKLAPEEEQEIFTNSSFDESINVESVIEFIDCPVEFLIVSMLWCTEVGRLFDQSFPADVFANRLVRNDEPYTNRLLVFEPYYIAYTNWRNGALAAVRQLHASGRSAILLNIDVREYYNSVDFKFRLNERGLLSGLSSSQKNLCRLLEKLHSKYNSQRNHQTKALPIGLPSSGIIANDCLMPLGTRIRARGPAYFGRYVDDLLFVVHCEAEALTDVKDYVDAFLKSIGIKKSRARGGRQTRKNGKNALYSYDHPSGYFLDFHENKMKVFYFAASENIALVESIERKIRSNSSEFRFLPEDDDVSQGIDVSFYNVHSSEYNTKLRSLEGVTADRYKVSKALAGLLNVVVAVNSYNRHKPNDIAERLSAFFTGRRAIEMIQLLEKTFIYFVICRRPAPLCDLLIRVIRSIERVGPHPDATGLNRADLRSDLHENVACALALALAYFPSDEILSAISRELSAWESKSDRKLPVAYNDARLREEVDSVIRANMLKASYQRIPLLGYIKDEYYKKVMAGDYDSVKADSYLDLFDEDKLALSPRFIQIGELEALSYFSQFIFAKSRGVAKWPESVIALLREFNTDKVAKAQWSVAGGIGRKTGVEKVPVQGLINKEKFRIALVHIEIDERWSLSNMVGDYQAVSISRRLSLHKLLNSAVENKCRLIVFPEISLPWQWLDVLRRFCTQRQIAVVAGLEHAVMQAESPRQVFNYCATILPCQHDLYHKDCRVILEPKLHYSPEEVKEIEGRGYKVPSKKTPQRDVYVWEGMEFAVFNCFELADIKLRANFVGKVDFIIVIASNADVPYFSAVAESAARDLHCYVVLVNNAKYGDSRIVAPSDVRHRDLLRIQGGKSPQVMVQELDIRGLRRFQVLDDRLQSERKEFKRTPPNFEPSASRRDYEIL